MKISASVFSNRQKTPESLAQALQECGVDFLHVDCNDDPAVGDVIARMRSVSDLPIDLHIISKEPEKFYPMIRELGVEMVTVQYEDLEGRMPEFPDLGCEFGLSIVTGTPVEAFMPFAGDCSFILFMTTSPGKSGGTFDKANFRKIRQFRRAFPRKRIHVDGGVNAEISFVLRNMGVYCAVSGSFLVNSRSIAKAFLNLLVQKSENRLQVSDFMYELDELPVLRSDALDTGELLRTIEEYRMGYCLLTAPDGRLAGLVSNADVRRGLLKHIGGLDRLEPADMVNYSPKAVHKDARVTEMLRYVKEIGFLVLYLPVVDDDRKLVGAVNFNNLILGEL